jgi:hypothetical protein
MGYTLFIASMAVYGASLWAQQDVKEQEPEHLAQRLDRIERALARAPADRATIKEWFEVVDAIKNRGARCVPATEKNIEKATEDLYKLGQPVKVEPIEVIRQRKACVWFSVGASVRLRTHWMGTSDCTNPITRGRRKRRVY